MTDQLLRIALDRARLDLAEERAARRILHYMLIERVTDAPATVYEIANHCGLSVANVGLYIKELNAQGWMLAVYAPVITEAA